MTVATPVRKKITVKDLEPVLKAIAEADPGHVDRRAAEGLLPRYVEHGKPNCLVARALSRLGFSVGVLKALDQEHPTGELVDAGVQVAESRHPSLKKLDPLAKQLLKYVQDQQDRGLSWGRVVADAFTARKEYFLGFRRERQRKPWLFQDEE